MLTFGFLEILSLVLALASLRALVGTIRDRRQLFDRDFTASDRARLSEAAFLLLLPVSVLLHELGHAVTVWAFGGRVVAFGFYFFFGYVEPAGRFTPDQLFWIALSGNLVSILLGAAAILVPLRWPRRPAVNYLLLTFGAIDLLNSLVFYPLLGFTGGFVGDWAIIYSRDTPLLSGVTGALHLAAIGTAIAAWRSDRVRSLWAVRTGLSPAAIRRVTRAQAAEEILAAGERVAARWPHPLRVVAESPDGWVGASLRWSSRGHERLVGAYALVGQERRFALLGAVGRQLGDGASLRQPLGEMDGVPTPEQLDPILLRALDVVEQWDLVTPSPS